jgi:hypothetical protein
MRSQKLKPEKYKGLDLNNHDIYQNRKNLLQVRDYAESFSNRDFWKCKKRPVKLFFRETFNNANC